LLIWITLQHLKTILVFYFMYMIWLNINRLCIYSILLTYMTFVLYPNVFYIYMTSLLFSLLMFIIGKNLSISESHLLNYEITVSNILV
jgi:hypothetical protein